MSTEHGTPANGTAARAAEDRQLVTAQVAAKLGIAPGTWRGYRSRPPVGNPVPEPDGWHDTRTAWWRESTIDDWAARRSGAGARTDLRARKSSEDAAAGAEDDGEAA